MTSETAERTASPEWTPRQRQVLDLLARGYTNGQIGEALSISLDGAKWHVSEVMSKLGVESREAAAAYWREYNRPSARLSRALRGLLLSPGLRWVGGTAAATVAASALVVALLLSGGGDQSAAPDETPSATSTPQAPPADLEAFARELLRLAAASDVGAIADHAELRSWTCPNMEHGNACEGQTAGTVVDGYSAGPLWGGLDGFRRDAFEDLIQSAIDTLGASELKLFTMASGGHLVDARVCVECASAVISTDAEADLSDRVAFLLVFEIELIEGAPRLIHVLSGLVDDFASPATRGGEFGHLQYRPVDGAVVTPGSMTVPVQVLARGEAVQGDYGLLYLDPATGGGRFWPLPEYSWIDMPSRSGRWVVWADPDGRVHLLDTRTSSTRPIGLDRTPATHATGYSPDETQMVVFAGRRAAVVEIATGNVVFELPESDPLEPARGISVTPARWSADGSAVAVLRGSDDSRVVQIVHDGVREIRSPISHLQWSRAGLSLAMTGRDRSLLLDLARGNEVPISAPAINPRWSPDDRFIALATVEDRDPLRHGDIRVFETATGQEVLRVLGIADCVGDFWLTDGSLPYSDGKGVAVPSGELVTAPANPRNYRYELVGSVQIREGSTIAAEVRGVMGWAVAYNIDGIGYYRKDAPPAVIVGGGGKDLCMLGGEPGVQKPPF